MKEKTDRTFDSMGAASAALNIPRIDLKWAKNNGCAGFVGGRVKEKPLLTFMEFWGKNAPSKIRE